MEYKQLEDLIYRWGAEREIFTGSSPSKQLQKLIEEVGELVGALTKDEERDAIGDIVVCLLMYCGIAGHDLTECLHQAYNEIKDRKGRMVNGVFVKQS